MVDSATHMSHELSKQAHENRQIIAELRSKFLHGEITYSEAEKIARPILAKMNERGKEIAKEYGGKFKPLTFSYLIR